MLEKEKIFLHVARETFVLRRVGEIHNERRCRNVDITLSRGIVWRWGARLSQGCGPVGISERDEKGRYESFPLFC